MLKVQDRLMNINISSIIADNLSTEFDQPIKNAYMAYYTCKRILSRNWNLIPNIYRRSGRIPSLDFNIDFEEWIPPWREWRRGLVGEQNTISIYTDVCKNGRGYTPKTLISLSPSVWQTLLSGSARHREGLWSSTGKLLEVTITYT